VPKLRNCFGFDARDSGQSLVPDPPLKMTGMMPNGILSIFAPTCL
jgi:hypothetical protein